MRFGREQKDGLKGATVYVHTAALPEWIEPKKRLASVDSWITQKNGMKQVINAIYNLDDWHSQKWKVGEVSDRVTISERYVRKHLKTLVKHEYLDSRRGGTGNAFHFSNLCLENAGKYGHVEFSE